MGNPKRKIAALHGGVMVSGAKVPTGWAANLAQYAADHRLTRAALVRDTLAAWLKKNQQYTSIQHAADVNDRSYGMQVRQILEDELPSLCPPIEEYRGNGAAWANAIRAGRSKGKIVPTCTITLPEHAWAIIRKIATAKADVYPTPEAVVTHLVTRWADKQIEAKQGMSASNNGV